MQESLIRSALAHKSGEALLAKFKRDLLIEVLRKFNGNQTLSAKNMGMNRGTLRAHMESHNIKLVYK